jgi:hypothetical protein
VFHAYGIIHAYAYASGFASYEDRGTWMFVEIVAGAPWGSCAVKKSMEST